VANGGHLPRRTLKLAQIAALLALISAVTTAWAQPSPQPALPSPQPALPPPAVQAAPGAGQTKPAARTAPALEPAAGEASEPSVAALIFDLERIVASEESGGGWLLEGQAQDAIHHDVMESVCRATPAVRARALQQLAQRAASLGEPSALFEREGGRLTSAVESALSAQRELAALQRAVSAAPRECPFWVRPDPQFRGLQSMRDRWLVNFDTGGTAQLRRTQGAWSVGAGGFGRALGGYGFTHVSLLAGLEFGGGALVVPDSHPTAFLVNYIPALPVIVRLHHDAWNVDLEGAGVGLFQAGNNRLSYGVRGGVTIGVSALRVRGILPWVGLGIATEYHFENSARPEAWYLRGGLRVGGVWDP
jgi:hypothetical protein